MFFFFFQAEDGIRDAQESRGLGDVYKRQSEHRTPPEAGRGWRSRGGGGCLLYTSDAADDLTRVDLGGRRIIADELTRVDLGGRRIIADDLTRVDLDGGRP